MEELAQGQAQMPVKKKRRNKFAAPLGGAYLILAVIGAIAVIFGAIKAVEKLTDNSKLLRKLELQIMPVMMFDPVPFEDIHDVENNVLLKSSIWSSLYSDKRSGYAYDDNGMILIPVSDVDVAAAKLFGPDVQLVHTSMEDDGISYTYDEENHVYRIPMMAQAGYYTPMIEELKRVGDIYEMKVGYVPPGADWTVDSDGNKYQPKPDKYMVYNMKKQDGEYYIVGIKDPGEAAIDTTNPTVVPGLSSQAK